jgi:lysophospholipase L1-like esterase
MICAALLGLLSAVAVQDAAKPVPRDAKWVERHEALVKRAKEGAIDVLFLGDSITEGWRYAGKKLWEERFAPLKAANFGLSGDRTQHVLWRIDNGELDGFEARAIVLLIGTNNTHEKTDTDDVTKGVEAILKRVAEKQPKAKTILVSVFPRGEKPAPIRDKIKALNASLTKLADGKSVVWLDAHDKFLAEDEAIAKDIMPDFLHLSAKGYAIWADALKEPLEKVLARK